MAGGSGGGQSRSLQDTPTWALATVCFVFIAFSIFVEHLIHLLCNWLKKHRKVALFEAVEKLKSVLIILGFMSLILAVTQRPISRICIPTKVADTLLPCRKSSSTKTTKAIGFSHLWAATPQNSLSMKDLFEGVHLDSERRLAEKGYSASSDYCESQGKTSLISQGGINQLNNFLVVLAMMQIVYSVLTMALGRAKMRRWESWEMETRTVEYQVANDPNRFRLTRQTTFSRRHMNSWAKTSTLLLWIKCFFRQFFHSVAKVDYLTLRHSFISAHMSASKTFDFQKYIQRSLEDDFKVVVGISPFMWFIVVIFMLVDVYGWHVYLWVSFIPLLIVLVLGTKLEVIMAKMALKLHHQNSVVIGTPLVEPNDNLFWFGHPKFVLTLLHLTLFMNSFELAFFIWVTAQFGFKSCYHERTDIIIIRVVLAVTVQVMCSYITLPLYALVTQMGSSFKRAMLEEETRNIIKQWHSEVKDKRKKQDISQFSVDNPSSTPMHTATNTSTSSSSDPSSRHRGRALTFGEITYFSSETELNIVQNHQQIGQNELEQFVVSSAPEDIETEPAAVGQH